MSSSAHLLWPIPPGTARAVLHRGGRPGRPWARAAAAPSRPRAAGGEDGMMGLMGRREFYGQGDGEDENSYWLITMLEQWYNNVMTIL